jgi:hypothetical protein
VTFKKGNNEETKLQEIKLVCYPNPFHLGNLTLVNYLANSSDVIIEIYDNASKLLLSIEIGNQPAGNFTYIIDDIKLESLFSPGCYLIKMKTNDYVNNIKLIVR